MLDIREPWALQTMKILFQTKFNSFYLFFWCLFVGKFADNRKSEWRKKNQYRSKHWKSPTSMPTTSQNLYQFPVQKPANVQLLEIVQSNRFWCTRRHLPTLQQHPTNDCKWGARGRLGLSMILQWMHLSMLTQIVESLAKAVKPRVELGSCRFMCIYVHFYLFWIPHSVSIALQ